MNDITSKGGDAQGQAETVPTAKPKWEKPEIVDFQPITVARGNGQNVGENGSNLT